MITAYYRGTRRTILNDLIRGTIPDGTYLYYATAPGRLRLAAVTEFSGYMVGGYAGSVKVAPGGDRGARIRVRAYIEAFEAFDWEGLNIYLGVWTDPETGVRHIEASERIRNHAAALSVARLRGEKEVWDWAACESIPVE